MDDWKILVTDGDALHSLVVVRSLGSKGMRVTMSSPRKVFSVSFYSKFCAERKIYPPPSQPEEFVNFLIDLVSSKKFDVLLPIRSPVIRLLAKNAEKFKPFVNFVLPPFESMKIADSKELTFKFAEEIGVPIPKTLYPSDSEFALSTGQDFQKASGLSFPVVAKPCVGAGSVGLEYLNSQEDLRRFAEKNRGNKWILQEYIQGPGYGFFALFKKGEPKAIFMHRRLREYPITGGPSTKAESVYCSSLKELGLKLLEALNWNGVAMVEFKLDQKDNEFKLMEVNPKFWGSLNLAVASGVDFPYLFCLSAMNKDFKPVFKYKEGVKFRWLFPGDFMYFLAKRGLCKDYFKDFFDPNVKYDIFLSDIKPNIVQLFLVGGYFIQNKGRVRYPQGKPIKPR
jgi:predicted ATP-grasp superfamily ATP-dependent carboligase